MKDEFLLFGEVSGRGDGVECIDAVVLAHVLQGRGTGPRHLVLLLLADLLDVERAVVAEDLGEDLLLVV